MESKLHGASEFRTKARSTIAHVVWGSINAGVASTRRWLTRQPFKRFCVKQPEQAARDLAPNEALRVLEQERDEFFHGGMHIHSIYSRAQPMNDASPAQVPRRKRTKGCPQYLRRLVIHAFRSVCQYCNQAGPNWFGPDGKAWHVDRILPGARGGIYEPSNITLSCAKCNLRKTTKEPANQPLSLSQIEGCHPRHTLSGSKP